MDNIHEPITKADLQALKAGIEERMDLLRSDLAQALDKLREALRETNSELLKFFYNYAVGNDTRLAETEAESAAIKKRIAALETRITELERRLIGPTGIQ